MKILIAGDVCLRGRALSFVQNNDPSMIWGSLVNYISADYSICNLEAPIVSTEIVKGITKDGPSLSHSSIVTETIKKGGFKCVTLANNHFRDFGSEGVKNTLENLNSNKIEHMGGGENLTEASKILYKKLDDIKYAFINCCENEFSIATAHSAGSNPINPISLYYAIKEAKENADFVIVITHGGHENIPLPSFRMKELYRWFVDIGADAIINHHQHCYMGYEFYKNKPIFYGIGNLCFDSFDGKTGLWNEGFMVELDFSKDKIKAKCIPYIQCRETPTIRLMNPNEKEEFNYKIQENNRIIASNELLTLHYQNWLDKKSLEIKTVLSPYSNRYLKFLCRRGLIPSFLNKKKAVSLLNYIRCESHRDRVIDYLKRQLK